MTAFDGILSMTA